MTTRSQHSRKSPNPTFEHVLCRKEEVRELHTEPPAASLPWQRAARPCDVMGASDASAFPRSGAPWRSGCPARGWNGREGSLFLENSEVSGCVELGEKGSQ